jgi:hypothetical protein
MLHGNILSAAALRDQARFLRFALRPVDNNASDGAAGLHGRQASEHFQDLLMARLRDMAE